MFLLMHLSLQILYFSCSERIKEGLAVEVTFSYPSYKTPKFYVNSLALSSSAARPLFPTLADLTPKKTCGKPVIIISATNRPNSRDRVLGIAGRLVGKFSLTCQMKLEERSITLDYF